MPSTRDGQPPRSTITAPGLIITSVTLSSSSRSITGPLNGAIRWSAGSLRKPCTHGYCRALQDAAGIPRRDSADRTLLKSHPPGLPSQPLFQPVYRYGPQSCGSSACLV